jgi:mRNA-degrading endonuclease RelE of RelBE toxin-antitoxin system
LRSAASGTASLNWPKIRSIRAVRSSDWTGRHAQILRGRWRILFMVDRETKLIDVLTVDTRGQAYKHS